MKNRQIALAVATLLAAAGSAHAVEIKYVLWDSNQRPAYQNCANEFQKANKDITVKITQQGWDDYWTGISTGFISGTAPVSRIAGLRGPVAGHVMAFAHGAPIQ